MDATLRITPHKQDVSSVNKEGVIEQQDDSVVAGFEMPSTLPVTDNEMLTQGELTESIQPQTITSENTQWLAGIEISTDKTPKSTQQTVEELNAASTRKLSASFIMAPSQQVATSDDVRSMVDGVVIKSEIPLTNTVLTENKAKHSSAPVATSDAVRSMVDGVVIKSEIPLTNTALTVNKVKHSSAPVASLQQAESISISLSELANRQPVPRKSNTTLGAFNRAETITTTFSDLQVAKSGAIGVNVIAPVASVKALEWAKVDLTPTINNLHDKSLVSSQIGEKLNAILQDKINIQAANGIKVAQIRLDPPDMGHIKLIVSIEGDKVSVNMSAQNATVREGLIQTSERLRNDLVNENFVNVAINIDAGSGSGKEANKEQSSETIANNFFAEKEVQQESQDEFIVKI
ncbi:flagellar hook-length control protein FliK [Psychromonas sp. Urea-02u-13]|uniref:flagellar hook-length control protein FliK n=1 Tax=Psychromonas sp. Urea-02u-13 TaxID=2058326 RepID=UPI000C32D021|nr:flagellar hook-length control protein FliK [Psychromonas sp. Urea-02u-13]PKG40846.1 hypothetical protein CXF74_00565 [Psychromonas sp. Urea-02u-13]